MARPKQTMNKESRTESIFRQFSAALKNFILKQSSASPSEAEDLLQDVFYKFIVADGEDELIENVSSWLYRVTRNQIIDNSRKRREERMPLILQNQDGEVINLSFSDLLSSEGDYNFDPESQIARSMIREELNKALEELPTEQRTIFELTELQGFSFKEIAQATQTPINTLLSRKRYAVQHLQHRLTSLYRNISQ